MGIGAIPDAVLSQLGSHRDLGIHTEMMSDGVVDLVHKGVVTNSEKEVHIHYSYYYYIFVLFLCVCVRVLIVIAFCVFFLLFFVSLWVVCIVVVDLF